MTPAPPPADPRVRAFADALAALLAELVLDELATENKIEVEIRAAG